MRHLESRVGRGIEQRPVVLPQRGFDKPIVQQRTQGIIQGEAYRGAVPHDQTRRVDPFSGSAMLRLQMPPHGHVGFPASRPQRLRPRKSASSHGKSNLCAKSPSSPPVLHAVDAAHACDNLLLSEFHTLE